MKIKLGEALRYEQPTKYIVASEKYNDSYATPVLTAGKSFILGYTNEESGIYDNLPVIIFDDFTTDIKYVDFPFKVKSSAMKMLQPANENYNLKFFYYLIKYMNFQPTSHQRHWISKFAEMEFDIPERVKQDQIVEKLDKLVEMQSKKTTQLKKYDDLVKSQFIEMFGDVNINDKNWNHELVGEAFNVSSGGTPSTTNEDYWKDGKISWIGSNLCQNNILYQNDGKFISQKGYDNSSAKLFAVDTVLVALVGATIGKTALLKFETTTNQNIAGIDVPNNPNYTPEYVYFALQQMYGKFLEIGNGKFKMANLSFVRNLDIPTPPIVLQNQFADFVKHIDKLKFTIKQSVEKLELCYKSLMKQYFE